MALLAALGLLSGAALAHAAETNQAQFKAEVTLKEGFDGNVYIQNVSPLPANVNAAKAKGLNAVPAHKASSVTTILPRFVFAYQPSEAFNLLAAYSPEFVYYSNATMGHFVGEDSENYLANRVTLNFGGKTEAVTYELNNTAYYIYGNNLGPTFGRPGDIPAIGGIPLRDRRQSFVFRNNFRLTYPVRDFKDLFIRPVFSSVFWNFMTLQKASPTATQFVYENYIDRRDVSGGLDLGYTVGRSTAVVLGYRYGSQDQGLLLGVDSPYDNTYNRILVGVEGTPWSWLKLGVLVGPDIRDFYDQSALRKLNSLPANKDNPFNRNQVLVYVDATVTFIPSANDTIALFNRRFEQPAFSSHSMYEDITYSILWKHKLDDSFSFGAGFQLYIGDWQPPVKRDDWIYTPSASAAYTYKQFSAELAYSYDAVQNRETVIPGTQTAYADGRRWNRSLLTLSVKYSL